MLGRVELLGKQLPGLGSITARPHSGRLLRR